MKNRFLKIVAALTLALSAAVDARAALADFPGIEVPSIRPQVQQLRALAALPAVPQADAVGAEHLVMGNPSGATADAGRPNDYLLRKAEYVLSYNSGTGTPNWVSWHLNSSWIGDAKRSNSFRPDTTLPAGFLQVAPGDYTNSGFDRGHMCNSGDRTRDDQTNSQTFLMSNMVPQSPKNNEHTWEGLESYSRTLAAQGDELYIVSGPSGRGGAGKNGPLETITVNRGGQRGTIVVPAVVWKVILVLPRGATSPDDVTAGARTIAVIMPNTQDLDLDWKKYIVTVSDVERLTGFTFFSAVDPGVAAPLKQQTYRP